MTPELQSLRQRVRVMRVASASSWLLLILLLVAMSFLATPEGTNVFSILLFQTLPLLIFTPGMIAGNPRTHVWLCFVSLLYFTQGVLTVTRPGYLLWGGGEIALAISLFTDAFLYVRWSTDLRRLSKE